MFPRPVVFLPVSAKADGKFITGNDEEQLAFSALIESWNHRMAWFGRHLKYHLDPTPPGFSASPEVLMR